MENPAVKRGATAVTWETAVERWRSYIQKTRDTSLRFDQVGGDSTVYHESTHRWSPDYQERQYARMKDMERGIDAFYGDVWTAMITLTASSDSIAPVDHLDELLDGREKALAALRRALDGRTWDYWWVLEPHKSGYLHLHLAVVVEGPIKMDTVWPVVEAHLRNCEPAGEAAHPRTDDTVDIRRGREIQSVAAYLNAYLGDYRSDPLDAPEHEQMANAVLWATQRRQTGASKRLRKMMQAEEPEIEEDWELVAIVDADGEERPVDDRQGGGVETVTTTVRWGDDDRGPPNDDPRQSPLPR